MIEVKNLSKQFKAPTEEKGLFGPKKKAFWAVKDLDFQIKKAL
jgi:ABC-type oligopeptide transport system ATPase subunit